MEQFLRRRSFFVRKGSKRAVKTGCDKESLLFEAFSVVRPGSRVLERLTVRFGWNNLRTTTR